MYKILDVSNRKDVLDSRDVEKRIDELIDERDSWQDNNELPDYVDPETTTDDSVKEWTDEQVEKWTEWDESDEGTELKSLLAFRDEMQDYCEWRDGASLIRETYFTEYIKEEVNDTGDLPKDLPSYIENNINWDGVAEDLQADYTSGDYDGVTYWVRSS